MKLKDISKNPNTLYLNTIITFGKYRGFKVKDLVIKDIDYVLYLIRMYEHPIDETVRKFVKEEWFKQGRQK